MKYLALHQDVAINGKNYRITGRSTKGGNLMELKFMIHNLADVSEMCPRIITLETMPLPILLPEGVMNHPDDK